MERLKQLIECLQVGSLLKDQLLAEVKAVEKQLVGCEFKYSRTLMDKNAITNILNASISEIEKQKKIIEDARNKINENLQALDHQKKLIEIKNGELNKAMDNLKSTQRQLIESEKMASLGELTAGIAHEIQNPLNFVNNFSEVNTELLEELSTEADDENKKMIISDLKQNCEKILFHGKRADAIVKNMLQHSQKNKGSKESTDINALADEFLRLSYHGLRAKDQNFVAEYKTEFDQSIGKIKIYPQDVGRVLLNLCNNAFYAVNEKKKIANPEYHPLVTITTRKTKNDLNKEAIEIIITDNGMGVPEKIRHKIFQPFFTTKPAGKGTGLGLSLSYDIITKEHEGKFSVESTEGQGSSFVIELPVDSGS